MSDSIETEDTLAPSKGFKFPTAYTILFALIALVALGTWIVPAGQYQRAENAELGREVPIPGTYETVDANPQGIVDVFDFLDNEYSEVIIENSTEEEIEEFINFQTEVTNFNNITGEELDFQLEMKCGKDNKCRAEYAQIVVKGFEEGLTFNQFCILEVDQEFYFK